MVLKMKGKRSLLVNDSTNWYHFGCTATSLALKESILNLGFELTSLAITETYKVNSCPVDVQGFSDKNNLKLFVENNLKLIALI